MKVKTLKKKIVKPEISSENFDKLVAEFDIFEETAHKFRFDISKCNTQKQIDAWYERIKALAQKYPGELYPIERFSDLNGIDERNIEFILIPKEIAAKFTTVYSIKEDNLAEAVMHETNYSTKPIDASWLKELAYICKREKRWVKES